MTSMMPPSADRQPISPAGGVGPSRPSAAEATACAQRLEALAGRFVAFLRNQIAQLEELGCDFAGTAADQAACEQMVRELQQQRLQWEQEKRAQAEKIAAETRMLTAAWDEIEAERRRLLTDESTAASSESAVESAPAAPSAPETPSLGHLFDCGVLGSGHSAALQFHQIKREIRQHARRHK
jgi:hypothetical protein